MSRGAVVDRGGNGSCVSLPTSDSSEARESTLADRCGTSAFFGLGLSASDVGWGD